MNENKPKEEYKSTIVELLQIILVLYDEDGSLKEGYEEYVNASIEVNGLDKIRTSLVFERFAIKKLKEFIIEIKEDIKILQDIEKIYNKRNYEKSSKS